jgi:hypothetical protein
MTHSPTQLLFRRHGLARLIIVAASSFALAAADLRAQAPAAVVQVDAAGATCAAVHDQLGILVIGQKGAGEHHLSVYQLDPSGHLSSSAPAKLRLPRPDSLGSFANYPLSLVFHPSLPLLYVWQDLVPPKAGTPEEKTVYDAFEHLLIAGVTDRALRPVGRLAVGEQFGFGQTVATIAVDPAGERLFMPNLHDLSADTHGRAALGYFDLDEQGMPRPVSVPIEGSLDGYGLNKFELQMRPATLLVGSYQALPAGWGFFSTSKHVVAFGWSHGVAVWDTENRRAELSAVTLLGMAGRSHPGQVYHAPQCWIGGDPRLPVLYGVGYRNSNVFSIQQVDGYPTFLPQITTVAGARFSSGPLVMTGKSPRIAIGGENCVHLLALDADGRFTGEAEAIQVANPSVLAIAHSEKHDRLYVAVEKAP